VVHGLRAGCRSGGLDDGQALGEQRVPGAAADMRIDQRAQVLLACGVFSGGEDCGANLVHDRGLHPLGSDPGCVQAGRLIPRGHGWPFLSGVKSSSAIKAPAPGDAGGDVREPSQPDWVMVGEDPVRRAGPADVGKDLLPAHMGHFLCDGEARPHRNGPDRAAGRPGGLPAAQERDSHN
jgi:hypothetical protein